MEELISQTMSKYFKQLVIVIVAVTLIKSMGQNHN